MSKTKKDAAEKNAEKNEVVVLLRKATALHMLKGERGRKNEVLKAALTSYIKELGGTV